MLLRIGMALTLIIAVFGLIPRHGFDESYIPTLFVSDLQLPNHLMWLKWVELLTAVCLLLGIFVRLQGVILLILLTIAFYQYGGVVIYYAGYIAAIAIYLIMMGGGKFGLLNNKHYYKHGAVLTLRVLTGLNFIYGGIYYKFLHPNIDIGMLTIHHTFTFGLGADVFTLLMALVETALGILLVLGIFIRPLAIIIFGFFILLGALVNENIFAHSFIIGILCVIFLNSDGRGPGTIYKKTHKN